MIIKCPICSNNNKLQTFESIKFLFINKIIICGECYSKLKYNLLSSIISEFGFILILIPLAFTHRISAYSIFMPFLFIILSLIFTYLGEQMPRILVQEKGDGANKAQSCEGDDQEKTPIAGDQ